MARTKEEEYQDKNKRLKELGIKPVHNSLKEERKAIKEIRDKVKCFSVNSKDLFDEKKNPGLNLSPESIIGNKKIPKELVK